MRLELGRRADYAVRAVVDLARHHGDGSRRKSREIAAEMEIPATYIPQILAELVRTEIVESVAGPGGGYVLTQVWTPVPTRSPNPCAPTSRREATT